MHQEEFDVYEKKVNSFPRNAKNEWISLDSLETRGKKTQRKNSTIDNILYKTWKRKNESDIDVIASMIVQRISWATAWKLHSWISRVFCRLNQIGKNL